MAEASGFGRGLPGIKAQDSKRLWELDRIVAWSFRVAKEQEPGIISRSWVAKFLKRDESWVRRNWNQNLYAPEETSDESGPLSQESKEIIRKILARPKKQSLRDIHAAVDSKRRKTHSFSSVYRFLKEEKAKAFHVVSAPKITELYRENRLSFCEYLRDWDEDDFLHLAPSDEFFVYAERKPNMAS